MSVLLASQNQHLFIFTDKMNQSVQSANFRCGYLFSVILSTSITYSLFPYFRKVAHPILLFLLIMHKVLIHYLK
jgi:hypothetical protein